jgi:hypothetical protein
MSSRINPQSFAAQWIPAIPFYSGGAKDKHKYA